MLLIVFVLTCVLSTVRPTKIADAIHLIMLPLTFVDTSIVPFVGPSAMDL